MVATFNGKDCQVQIYIGATPGAAPTDAGDDTWDASSTSNIVAVGTGVDVNTSKTLTPHHGLNQSTPQIIKEGNITYDWSIDALYTTQTYGAFDMLDLINESKTFAMKISAMNDSDVAQATAVLTYCKCSSDNWSVSDDGDLTCSLSGQSQTRTIA